MKIKNCYNNYLLQQETINICNGVANNTSTDINVSKDQVLTLSQENVAIL